MNEQFNGKPQLKDSSIFVPVTFGGSRGRTEENRTKIWGSVITLVIFLFISFAIFRDKDLGLVNKVFRILLVFGVMFTVLRLFILRERRVRKEFKQLDEEDFKLDYEDIWGIYGHSAKFPQLFYLRNGDMMVALAVNKDVVVGKRESNKFYHYEAIAEAYNFAFTNNMEVTMVDYMDSVGTDPRIEEWYEALADVENPDIKEGYSQIYLHLKDTVSGFLASKDLYFLYFKGSEMQFMYLTENFASILLEGEYYTSYGLLDRNSIQEIVMNLFNLKEFSFIEATQRSFEGKEGGNIKVITRYTNGEYEKVGTTIEEEVELRRQEEEEKLERKKHKRKKKKKKEENAEDQIVDIF